MPDALICSADLFPRLYQDGKFNATLLPQAHAACLRAFVEATVGTGRFDEHATPWRARPTALVVDNTNTTVAEIAPYAALALAYGHELEIVTLWCPPDVGASRNTHGVPLAACQAMHDRLNDRKLPPWWNHREIGRFHT